MEFEELQKIWDTRHEQPLYVINEEALHHRIVEKKHHVIHITVFTEWLLIAVNIGTGVFLLETNVTGHGYFFIYLLAAWMFGCALYVLMNRIRRIGAFRRFDRTLLGDLQHAITAARYQVRISHIMRWNVVPVGILVILSLREGDKPVWLALVVALFFLLVFYASGWEHRIYKAKKQELEGLMNRLTA